MAASRDTLAFVDKTVPGSAERILAEFPPDTRALWDGVSRLGWMPIEHDHFLADATIKVLGQQRAVEIWRASVANLIEQPLLKTFVSGMITIFGDNRARVVGLFPRAFTQIYRDFCDLQLVQLDGGARLVFTDVADQLWQHPSYLQTWRAAAMGTLDVAHLEGSVELQSDKQARTVEIELHW